MSKYVVDASVILKWVLGDQREADQGQAQDLLAAWADGRAELVAPSLWQYEVGNFLGREAPGSAAEKMQLLLNLGIDSVELNQNMFEQCFYLMRKKRVTFYDASYLAVACEIQATLITADKKFCGKLGKPDHICLLKDLGGDKRGAIED